MQKTFSDVVARIQQEDPRYGRGVYFFIREALDFTLKRREEEAEGREDACRHVSGQELLDGIRIYALEQYGPMAKTVFDHWNVREGVDFGRIVFQLVEYGVFGRTEEDSLEDFSGSYNFLDAFVKPFLPERAPAEKKPRPAMENRGG